MWTQQDIDNLKRAMALGIRRVAEGGKVVEYNSRDEMEATLNRMVAEVHGRPPMNLKVTFRRGDR